MLGGFDKVVDSGARQEFGTGAVRDIQEGKGRYDLLPHYAILRLARHFENGAKKYGDDNWRKGIPLRRYLDSMMRHAFKFLAGSQDEDHLAAVIWNACCLCETQELVRQGQLPKELDNLPKPVIVDKLPDCNPQPDVKSDLFNSYIPRDRDLDPVGCRVKIDGSMYVPKGWGSELWLMNNDLYCGKILKFIKDKRCSYHYHKIKDETFYIQTGKLAVTYGMTDNINDACKRVLTNGETFHVPPNMRHSMFAVEDTVLFEFSTHHDDADSFRIIKGD